MRSLDRVASRRLFSRRLRGGRSREAISDGEGGKHVCVGTRKKSRVTQEEPKGAGKGEAGVGGVSIRGEGWRRWWGHSSSSLVMIFGSCLPAIRSYLAAVSFVR